MTLADNKELAGLISDAQQRTQQPDADLADLLLDVPGDIVLRGAVPREQQDASEAG